jgi:hypothetical protein
MEMKIELQICENKYHPKLCSIIYGFNSKKLSLEGRMSAQVSVRRLHKIGHIIFILYYIKELYGKNSF